MFREDAIKAAFQKVIEAIDLSAFDIADVQVNTDLEGGRELLVEFLNEETEDVILAVVQVKLV